MSTITGSEVPYDKEDREIKTRGVDKEPEKSNTEGLDSVPKAILNMTVPKQFLILSMIIYGVIAYSKGECGVDINDLSLFIFFILFIIIVFVILTISKYLWNDFVKTPNSKIEKFYRKNFKKYLKLLIFIFLIVILLAIVFKIQIVMDFIKNFIEIFVNFKP